MYVRELPSLRRAWPVAAALAIAAIVILLPSAAHAAPANCDEPSTFDLYKARGWHWAYLAAFGFGFLTSLTPCVYPMIPIVLGVFGARGEQVGRGKAMLLATLYVIGMGVTYATLGVVFALIGGQFGSILANPAVVVPIVLLYAALAASMFGAFELNLPASWQAKLNTIGGAGYGGAFAMGLVGGFTAAPCTGPFLVGMIGFVAKTGSAGVGGSLLFVYALGMGVLFWVLAAFAVSLPRSGRWMEWVKSIGGIGLLAAAIHFLRPIIPVLRDVGRATTPFLTISILVGLAGLALGAVHLSFSDGTAARVRKSLGVLLVVIGTTGVIAWMVTPDRYLPWIKRDAEKVAALIEKEKLELAEVHPDGDDWLHPAEAAAFALARKHGKGVMIDFAADWCTPCAELELTFADPDVYQKLTDEFVHLKIDVSKGTDEDDEFQDRYGAGTLPAVVFLDVDAEEHGRVSEYLEPSPFLKILNGAIEGVHGVATTKPCVATK